MKLALFTLIFLTTNLWAKPLILISYYDPFQNASFNNSQRVAEALEATLNTDSSPVRIKLCALETKFDVSYAQLEDCIRRSDEIPAMVLGLGETGCSLKLEMVGRNNDHTFGADNAGVERKNDVIIPEAPESIGFTYPLDDMYCALDKKDRKSLVVSNFAGSFVCNNTAFQLAYFYQDLPTGFIHVPSNNCRNLSYKTSEAVRKLSVMITKVAELNPQETSRLPTDAYRVREMREYWEERDSCKHEFYKRARGVDERRGWF